MSKTATIAAPVPPDALASVHDTAVWLARYGYPATPSAIRAVLGPDLSVSSHHESRIAIIRAAIAELAARGEGPWQPGDIDAPDDEDSYEYRTGYLPDVREIALAAARIRCEARRAARGGFPCPDRPRDRRVYRTPVTAGDRGGDGD